MLNSTFFIWLALVCIWNFGYPQATPIQDVIIAVLLAVISYQLNQNQS
tara:strand:+ start:58 stop:201 length:144 start_codon:yes stop_codon:yes gene_type:complete